MGLTSIQKTKAFLHVSDSEIDDYVVQNLIDSVSDFIEKTYCNRKFLTSSYTEFYDGREINAGYGFFGTAGYASGATYKRLIILNQYPVTAVSGVWDDPNRIFANSDLIDPTSYIWTSEGRLELDGLFFSRGIQNIKVTYTAGYAADSIPNDLQYAVWKIVQNIYKSSVTAVNSPQRLSIITEITTMENTEARKILDNYRRINNG